MAQEAGHFQTLAWALGLKGLSPSVFRAVVESLMAGFLLIYLANTSELRRVMPIVGNFMLAGGMACLLVLVYGFFDPLVAAGVARIAFCIAAVAGFIIVYLLWRRGQTRAETAMLCWSVILAWTFLAFIVLASDPRSVSLSPVLLAGLCTVLVVMAFSLANYAFSHGGMARHFSHEAGRRALALAGARAYVWDWQADEGELHVGEELETALGLNHGAIVEEGADAFIDRIHPADRGSYLVAVEAAEEQGNGLIDRQFRMRHGDGGYRWFHLRGRAMPGPNKRAARCIGTLTDVTSAKLSEERLITDAVHDLVTGLPNRALFIDRLARAIAVADRFRGLTVAVIDIDRFRVVNDVLGHEAGDHLLTVIGRRLSSVIKATDSIARLTGGQFGAFFASETEAQDPVALTDTLRSAFTRAIDVDGQEVYLTACIGLCAHRGDGAPAEQLLADAAIALYEAKRRGHDSFETFRPSMRDERAELALRESELRRAIDRGEFEVHYQPIARLDDMTLAGFEALVRWRHPKLGLLAPESFISLAEQSGMIKEIGRIVLHETARQLGVWQRSFRQSEPIFVAVNISSAQLIEPGLFEDIQNVLRRESVARGSLKIEVTESLVMQSPERARQVLERFKDLGIGIACDDFGTGHSSLSNLRKMPFDTIKIDKSFIAADAEDERAQTILDAIVGMGSSLGLAVVAEGIESQEQIDRLGELGCEFGQGFFIGQPMTARMVSDSLGGLPYATTAVRSVISWLWERAMRSPTPAPAVVDLTAPAEDQRLPDLGIRARPEPRLAPAAFAPVTVAEAPSFAPPAPPPPVAVERETRPPAGLAPMAPRLARPASEADMKGAKDGKPKRGKRRVRKKRAAKENAPGDAQDAVKPDQA
jgi:diguanylate cyclase (GGDEF)-like protein